MTIYVLSLVSVLSQHVSTVLCLLIAYVNKEPPEVPVLPQAGLRGRAATRLACMRCTSEAERRDWAAGRVAFDGATMVVARTDNLGKRVHNSAVHSAVTASRIVAARSGRLRLRHPAEPSTSPYNS